MYTIHFISKKYELTKKWSIGKQLTQRVIYTKKYMPAFLKRLSVFYSRHNACFFDIMVRVLYIIHVILLTNKSL